MWREDRIQALLSTEDADVLFVSSTVPNQGKFYSQFDHIVLFSARVPAILERLKARGAKMVLRKRGQAPPASHQRPPN
jgi:hypothetical protein